MDAEKIIDEWIRETCSKNSQTIEEKEIKIIAMKVFFLGSREYFRQRKRDGISAKQLNKEVIAVSTWFRNIPYATYGIKEDANINNSN